MHNALWLRIFAIFQPRKLPSNYTRDAVVFILRGQIITFHFRCLPGVLLQYLHEFNKHFDKENDCVDEPLIT